MTVTFFQDYERSSCPKSTDVNVAKFHKQCKEPRETAPKRVNTDHLTVFVIMGFSNLEQGRIITGSITYAYLIAN